MSGQCRYMQAAYPILDASITCCQHRHDAATFALAHAMAAAFQQPDPTDEQVGWCMDDAAAVVDDFDPTPDAWTVTAPKETRAAGLAFALAINGIEYVVQESEWEPSPPVLRTTWESWTADDDYVASRSASAPSKATGEAIAREGDDVDDAYEDAVAADRYERGLKETW